MAIHARPRSGGSKLRTLRERAGLTQLAVELAAEIGSGYLQRVESGRVARPEIRTVERLLDALDARFPDRRDVLEAFGYAVAASPPDCSDRAWARAEAHAELAAAPFPAYVLDCTHRIVAWNDLVPRLFGLLTDDPGLGGLADRSLLAAWFDPASPLASLVAEPDRFLPALVRALSAEVDRFRAEPWVDDLVEGLRRDHPRFRRVWDAAAAEPQTASPSRALEPVLLNVPGVGILRFRLSVEPFVRDARFRLVGFLPADPRTMRRCAGWVAGAIADAHDGDDIAVGG